MAETALILASASPRRQELLRRYGYRFEVKPALVEEVNPAYFTVAETVLFNAKKKAEDIMRVYPDALILAADTLVSLEGEIFGKPRDIEEAYSMLKRLSGQVHQVFSGVWLQLGEHRKIGFVETSFVKFNKLSDHGIRQYSARINSLDKAGGYAAQDEGNEVIQKVEGSFTNVVGLPMERLGEVLKRFPGNFLSQVE